MPSPASITYFHGARLITGDGQTVITDGGIVVDDGVIVDIGPQEFLHVPENAARVDLTGKTVMPAIINPHGHIGYLRDATVSKENYSRENVLDHLHRLAYYGVSVFQSLGTDRDDVEINLRNAQRSGELDDPELPLLFTAGTGLVAPTPSEINGGPYFATDVVHEVATAEEARATVRQLARKQPDAIKFWVDDRWGTRNKLTPEVYTAIIEEAHHLGYPAIAHIFELADAKGVLRAGANGIAHMVRDPGPDAELIELLQRDDVFAFTSMGIQRTAYDTSGWLEEPALTDTVSVKARKEVGEHLASLTPEAVQKGMAGYAVLENSLRAYVEGGVRVLLSADTGARTQFFGIAEHREIESMVRAGMPVLQAIRSSTQLPAEVLGLTDRGTLKAGKRADLLVLDANPLDAIANTRHISAVYFAGHAIDREGLRARWAAKTTA
ncbi:amidohydrolase family protein [Streptomyces scabiei]|uniref:amidohydrolase family protein n=1 Tax=Streptomyces TaxID=1883 RepID=UPI00298F2083|nr:MULTISPECIES: amidohydrolase family protein [Streptomyces]MDW8471522.1 amidohydrolase family protein [Streptomyces scabiei]MDX2572018.1 amidohydrolase family protein [Streptomyces scabiei]MDX3151597.1 amidohydrolase family protein [Streptomyces scabiei]MDX3157397.1 amidohydrolase family protein [Streptomyces scabiei]MDX3256664.1 amidohydrolase family protein [Streptomyces scabiei]